MFERVTKLASTEGMAGPAFIMLVATVVGGACNFIFQFLTGNLLAPQPGAYAELLVFLSIFNIISVPSSVVHNVLIRYSSKYHAEGRDGVISWMMRRLLFLTFVAGLVIAVALMIVLNLPAVKGALNIHSTESIIIVSIGALIVLVSPIALGPLQGLQKFTLFGTQSVINFTLKLVLGVTFVYIGFGIAGGVGGVVLGLAVSASISFFWMRHFFSTKGESVHSRDMWWYTVPTFIGVLCYAVLTNIDPIFGNALLPTDRANVYGYASTLAHIVLFMPGAVAAVAFPKISKAHAERAETRRLLNTSLKMALALSGLVLLAYLLIPNLILDILLPGVAYRAEIVPFMQVLGLAMLFLGLANIFTLYGLATDAHFYIIIAALSVVVLFGLVAAAVALGWVFTPMMLSIIMLATGMFVVVLGSIYLVVIEREWRPRPKK